VDVENLVVEVDIGVVDVDLVVDVEIGVVEVLRGISPVES